MLSRAKMSAVVLLACMQLPCSALTKTANNDSYAKQLEQLDAFVKEQAAEDGFSGVVLVGRLGQAVLSEAVGFADRKTQSRINIDTKFDLGSMPKMFTAIAIAQLAEAGKLKYDDSMIKYLPHYPEKAVAGRVTIQQLLTHTAGFGNYFHPGFFEQRLSTVQDYL